MLEHIKERWNNLPAVKRRNVAILLLSALLLGSFILSGMMISGGTRENDLNHAPNELKRQTLELEPITKSEYLEAVKNYNLRAEFKEMDEARKRSDRISVLLAEFNNLPLNRKIGEGTTLLTGIYGELTSQEKRFVSIIFWALWLLFGLAASSMFCPKLEIDEEYRVGHLLLQFLVVCSGIVGFLTAVIFTVRDLFIKVCNAPLYTVGDPPFTGTMKRLKGSLRALVADVRGFLSDTLDILRVKVGTGLFCKPEHKRFDESDWVYWLRSGEPWSGVAWEGFMLAEGASLAELMERVLKITDRSSHPSMRFYLSTVIKAHIFLKDSQVSQHDRKMPYVRFNNPLIRLYYEFCYEHGVDFESNSGRVILELLRLLDEHGDCPSVMNQPRDFGSRDDRRAHEILRKVPLWCHSMNVANRLASRCMYQGEPLSRLLIASLAHDLGRMPHISKSENESHAQVSVRVLNNISGFDRLPYASDIRKAIQEHHDSCPATPLGMKLHTADHDARRFELTADSICEYVKWEMGSRVDAFSVRPTIYEICRAIYPYFMDLAELELLRDSLTACKNSADLVKDLERILRQPQFLFNDAFRVGAAIADIAGATLRRTDCKK